MNRLENEVNADQALIASRPVNGLSTRQMAQAIVLLADQVGLSRCEYAVLVARLDALTSVDDPED